MVKIVNSTLSGRILKIIIMFLAAIILIYAGMNIIGKIVGDRIEADGQWLSDQTNIIQYLYWPSYCVQIAEKNGIAIDEAYKAQLKEYTGRTLEKRTFNKINASFLLGQLLWLDEYYAFNYEEDIKIELRKFFDTDTNLFSWDIVSENKNSSENDQIDSSNELYNLMIINPANLSDFGLIEGFSEFLARPDNNIYSWSQIFEAASVLIDSGNQEMFDKKRIYALLKEKTDVNIVKVNAELMSGDYDISLDMIVCAKDFSDFKMFFENDKRYTNLNQSIYNKITTDSQIGYDKDDPLFALSLSMIHDVGDLKQNRFVATNYNKWLEENFHHSIENNLKKALGE
ncbi:MAG: hypothetical protein ACYCYI_08175 [Saccharofermentanales bacterium]